MQGFYSPYVPITLWYVSISEDVLRVITVGHGLACLTSDELFSQRSKHIVPLREVSCDWLDAHRLSVCVCVCSVSDAAPRLLQENQKYLSQLTSLMQEAADEQAKSIVVSEFTGSALQLYYDCCSTLSLKSIMSLLRLTRLCVGLQLTTILIVD